MRSLVIAAAITAAFATQAMASTPIVNPWVNDGDAADLNIQVGTIGEVWSALGTAQDRSSAPRENLIITNAAGLIPAGGKYLDTVSHFANINYEVSATLSGNIPEWTRFHVLVNISNFAAFGDVFSNAAGTDPLVTQTITWDRRSPAYVGNQPNVAYVALSGTYSATATNTPVAYAADAIHGLPAANLPGNPITVTWTIASVP